MDSCGHLESYLSDYQTETGSSLDHDRLRRTTALSKQSNTDYNTSLDRQSCSTFRPYNIQVPRYFPTDETSRRTRTKSSDSASATVLETLLERYERTLHERQRTIAIVNDELLDINDLLQRYKEKIQSPRTTESDRVNLTFKKNMRKSSFSKVLSP